MAGHSVPQAVFVSKAAPTREDVPRLAARAAWATTPLEWRHSLLQASGAGPGTRHPTRGAWYGAYYLARWECLPEPVRTGLIRRFASPGE
jgi:hypothetical protein